MEVPTLNDAYIVAFGVIQIGYALALGAVVYLRALPVNYVDETERVPEPELPFIVLFYPVLREAEDTMRTTFLTLERLDYPQDRYRVVAIPNSDDRQTIDALNDLKQRFSFLQVLAVPPTSHHSWNIVWDAWNATPKAYWWHKGPRARDKALPPKKTRQLIYAFYTIADSLRMLPDFLVDYIDADSCPPPNHFRAAAAGIRHYDVLQSQNICGNCFDSWATTMHAFDHMAWDGYLYPHLSANGRQPFWVLGKGLFFKASDLLALGGFHPWITIEDPEVGMRFWANGKRLGILESPLVEEVPATFAHGVTQRKRWVAGFFQSLRGFTLKQMGMTGWQRFRARLNFVPCLSLSLNAIGLPLGLYASLQYVAGDRTMPASLIALGLANFAVFTVTLTLIYRTTWRRSAIIFRNRRQRALYLMRVNPVFLLAWWLFWCVPLWIGFIMYLRDGGLIWERTVKNDANHQLVRSKLGHRDGRSAQINPLPVPERRVAMQKEMSNG